MTIDFKQPGQKGKEIASLIDHTLLKPDADRRLIERLCAEAGFYKFASVCVQPCAVKYCAQLLEKSGVKVCTVIGFPIGSTTTETKAFEASNAIMNGAQEVDMVINNYAMKNMDFEYILNDIRSVVRVARKGIVKVILETCLLTNDEKIKACELAVEAGAHFVKTSTGFSTGGATVEDIALMRQTVGDKLGVKASGGIKTLDDAERMITAGASRIGTSSGVAIVTS